MNRNLEKKKQNIYDRIGVVCDHFKPSSKIVHAEKWAFFLSFFFPFLVSLSANSIVYHNKILFLCVSFSRMFVVAFMVHQYRRTSTLLHTRARAWHAMRRLSLLSSTHGATGVDFIIKSFLVQFDRKSFIFSHSFSLTPPRASQPAMWRSDSLCICIYSHLLNRLIARFSTLFKCRCNKNKKKRNASEEK